MQDTELYPQEGYAVTKLEVIKSLEKLKSSLADKHTKDEYRIARQTLSKVCRAIPALKKLISYDEGCEIMVRVMDEIIELGNALKKEKDSSDCSEAHYAESIEDAIKDAQLYLVRF